MKLHKRTAAPTNAPEQELVELSKAPGFVFGYIDNSRCITFQLDAPTESGKADELVPVVEAALSTAQPPGGRLNYVHVIPDLCDRMVWRNHYFLLPVLQPLPPRELGDPAELMRKLRYYGEITPDCEDNPTRKAMRDAANMIEHLLAQPKPAV